MESALTLIADSGCEKFFSGSCRDDEFLTQIGLPTQRWCGACIAQEALDVLSEPAGS